MEEISRKIKQRHQVQADQVELIYYTDPLCCWSWGLEPQLRKLLYEYNGNIHFRICMSGSLPSWDKYNDSVNSISRPLQMGPLWMHAQHISGMHMENIIWMKDPPASSYPACIAVKAAGLQDQKFEYKYLRLLWEQVMLHGKNIAKETELSSVAETLLNQEPAFNVAQFNLDLKNGNGLEAFRADLQEVQLRAIQRFPTLVVTNNSNKGIIISGYRPYQKILESVLQVNPILAKTATDINDQQYINYWGNVTARELEEIK